MFSHVHRPHPTNGEPERILYDDCPRCDQHASNPTGLDPQHLAALFDQMVRVEDGPLGTHYRNTNEARACRHLYQARTLLRAVAAAGVKLP